MVVSAGGLGASRACNAGIREATARGCLTSTSLVVNGAAYEEAVREVVPECVGLGVGLALNLTDGPSARRAVPAPSALCDSSGTLRASFGRLAVGRGGESLMREVESELRAQIETALAAVPRLDHFCSHRHVHSAPPVFEVVCRLAGEYGIPYVRLPVERPHRAPPAHRGWGDRCTANLTRAVLMGGFARRNRRVARAYGVRTNDAIVGLVHAGHLDVDAAVRGVEAQPRDARLVELILHPARLVADRGDLHQSARERDHALDPQRAHDLRALLDPRLRARLEELGWRLTCYRCVADGNGGGRATHAHAHAEPRAAPPRRPRTARRIARPPLRTLAIVDETPFHQPAYVRRLITECDDLDIVAVAVVRLRGGGRILTHLALHAFHVGIRQALLLTLRRAWLRAAGLAPRRLRADHEASVRAVLARHGVPHRIVTAVNDPSFAAWAAELEPDLLLSSTSMILDEALLALPRVAAINRHSSLLPAYGGVLPSFRVLQHGERWTGASLHEMVRDVDRGGVLARKWVPVFPEDSVERLNRACWRVSDAATAEAARRLRERGRPAPVGDDGLKPSYYGFPTAREWRDFRRRGGRLV